MIILYDEKEQEFESLGIGVIKDATSCIITEELNGVFELEMEYPITGAHYKDLKEKRILLAKANDTSTKTQPFRIYKISKPIDGIVTVYAEHISYDMVGVPIKKLSALNLAELRDAINNPNNRLVSSNFVFEVDQSKLDGSVDRSYMTKIPYNMRSLLIGNSDSVLNTYEGEFIFDRYNVRLCDRRGIDRDFYIRYSKNMTDIDQDTSSELLYDGLHPYYNNTTTETKTGITKKYYSIYVADPDVVPLKDEDGNDIYPSTWLTYNSTGVEALQSIISLATTNIIATEGDFFNHLVRAKETIAQGTTEKKAYFYDVTYNIAYINTNYLPEYGKYWLCKDEELTIPWNPTDKQLFRIYTNNDKIYQVFIYEESTGKYRRITSDDGIEEYLPVAPSIGTTTEEKDNTILYEGSIIYVNEIRGLPKEGSQTYGSDWLQEISENEQYVASDPRWKVEGDITPAEGIIYKVPTIETFITAYAIDEKSKTYDENWLTLTKGSTVPLVPVDNQGYKVIRSDDKEFFYRWSAYKKLYVQVTDTRYTYTNYEWNGNSYVLHDSSTDKILTIDLTDKFKDTPTDNQIFQKKLYDESVKYIKENKIGQLKDSIKVSFIKLSNSSEYSKWKNLEKVALGDTVHVEYDELGVNTVKKVIKVEFDVLKDRYNSIELGESAESFTNNAVITGDDVSALTNDRHFADITTVTKLVAERIEADYLKTVTAEITDAQIQTLRSESVTAALIDAERAEIDRLVAELMIADNAIIRDTLMAGDVIVNGIINVKNGTISISGTKSKDESTVAYVYEYCQEQYDYQWLAKNKNDDMPMLPEKDILYHVYDNDDVELGYYKYSYDDSKYIKIELKETVYFEVDESGNVTANSLEILGGSISIIGRDEQGYEKALFKVDGNGNFITNSVSLEGGNIETLNITGTLYFGADSAIADVNKKLVGYEYKYPPLGPYTIDWVIKDKDKVETPYAELELEDFVDANPGDLVYVHLLNGDSGYYKMGSDTMYQPYNAACYINSDGLKLFGITATVDETNIAGFNVTDHTMTSSDTNQDPDTGVTYTRTIGISTDKNEGYAFMATSVSSIITTKVAIASYEPRDLWLTWTNGSQDPIIPEDYDPEEQSMEGTRAYIIKNKVVEYYIWYDTTYWTRVYPATENEKKQWFNPDNKIDYHAYIINWYPTIRWLCYADNPTRIVSPDTTSIYETLNTSFSDYYKWDGTKYYSYYISNEVAFSVTHDGYLKTNYGKIGNLYVGTNEDGVTYLTTNEDKQSLIDMETDGLIFTNEGLSFSGTYKTAKNYYETKLHINNEFGLWTNRIGIDPLGYSEQMAQYYSWNKIYNDATLPMLTTCNDYIIQQSNNIYVNNAIYNENIYFFTNILENVILPSGNTAVNINYRIFPRSSDPNMQFIFDTEICSVFIQPKFDGTNYSILTPTYEISDTSDGPRIIVYNGENHDVTVDIMVIFKYEG